MTYSNARRAGRTQPGQVEHIDKKDPRFSVAVRPGYRVKPTGGTPNRAAFRSALKEHRGIRGFLAPAPYRRVRSLRTIEAREAAARKAAA